MEVVEQLNRLLASFDNCQISFFDGWRLVVIGDFDLTYHHRFEAEFLEVSYVQCPSCFYAQSFRLATPLEIENLDLVNYLDSQESVFCFESDGKCFFIAALSLTIREGSVSHFKGTDA